MKAKLRNHLYYHWWFYAISAVAVVALWLSVFSRLAMPKAHEQINITYIGSSFDHMLLEKDIRDLLPGRTGQKIKRVTVENAVVEGEYDFNTILRARAAGSCDFFIIEDAVLDRYQANLASYFPALEDSALDSAVGGVERVREDGKIYGLACGAGSNVTSYYAGKGVCKIFFNAKSVNLSDLFGGATGQNAALEVVRYLTEGKDVQT